ncbi:hypothetical protein WISP_43552 [Willisornis vidua]|uniref:Uncharacterized protein n=1 Tax=Willisornis vidua TaxID=1566151 RepID=A0ABQ9DIY5_9PASS|nr:hypothetical protein WISP_43552 [Willisornis vidua]
MVVGSKTDAASQGYVAVRTTGLERVGMDTLAAEGEIHNHEDPLPALFSSLLDTPGFSRPWEVNNIDEPNFEEQ